MRHIDHREICHTGYTGAYIYRTDERRMVGYVAADEGGSLHAWLADGDKLELLKGADPTGEGDVEIPIKFEVCDTCRGSGHYVNPSIDSHWISGEELDDLGPEFLEDRPGIMKCEVCFCEVDQGGKQDGSYH